jgi:hypothetical protein
LLCLCATFVALAQQPTKTTAAVPRLVKFSGTLTGSTGQPLSGAVGVTFALYEEERGGAPLWMETQNVQADGNGHYTAMLGSTRNDGMPAEVFASGQGRWLGVQPQGEPERPRLLMASVPYALKAVDAETLGGLPASAFALAGAANHGPVTESAAGPVKPVQSAAAATPNQTGSGTTNYITIWTGTTTLGNSKLYQAAASGNVGLGTTTPTAKLEAITGSATGTGVLGYAAATTGANFGVTGTSTSSTGTGVRGQATATGGANFGVYGSTASPAGTGVNGVNTATSGGNGVSGTAKATSGSANGVYGQSASPNGNGVSGNATATSGSANGVSGQTASPDGWGVAGQNNATSGLGAGVLGQTNNPAGHGGVYGINHATSGLASGVVGESASTSGTGVTGRTSSTSGSTNGVYGESASTSGSGVSGNATATSGSANGVFGQSASPAGAGISGVNNATSSGNGVQGYSNATSGGNGVYGQCASTSCIGVMGNATATTGGNYGVQGFSNSTGGVGVQGNSPNVAVLGISQTCGSSGCTWVNGTAGQFVTAGGGTILSGIGGTTQVFRVDGSGNGYFAGNLNVTGNLTKGSGSFKIDHPLDPANKYLSHSFVESPDMMNVYNGIVRLDAKGEAWVNLPDYLEALNGDFRYQLTAVGTPAPRLYVAREVAQNRFKIAGGRPGGRVSWQVTGIRHDAYANAHRIPVTEEKPREEQGMYLHPDVFGQGDSSQVGAGSH